MKDFPQAHPLLAPVVELALQAGEAILPFWRTATEVMTKTDDSPVTAADLAAHHVILAGLTALDPSIPVLSEEDANIPQAVRAGWQRWWLVDPLDGTKEFIAGSEEFTVNIALIEQGRVVFGVVSMPTNGRCYFGGDGLGAWRADQDSAALPIQVRLAPAAGRSLYRGCQPPPFQPGTRALAGGLECQPGRVAAGEHRQLVEVLLVGRRCGGLLSAVGADLPVGHRGSPRRTRRRRRRGAGVEWRTLQLSCAGVAA